MLGRPVKAYLKELNELIDAKIIVPEYSDVGNAVGALAGKGTKRIEITIRTLYSESKYDLRTKGVFVYTPTGRRHFVVRSEALEFAEAYGRELILDYMAESGLSPEQVIVNIEKKEIKTGATEIPLETRFLFEGVVNSNVYEKALYGQVNIDKNPQALKNQVEISDCNFRKEISASRDSE